MLFIKRAFKIIIIVDTLFLLTAISSFALDDGFGPARKIDSEHFTVYYSPELDASILAQHLNISISDKILVGKSVEKAYSSEIELADMLDVLFMRVCDILDMHLYSFKGSIKVCSSQGQLDSSYYNLFRKDIAQHLRSFYVYDINTIYITAENFSRAVLGHEVAHAVISHYFVVQPSTKVQEVLAGYIEYQLRKTAQ